MTTLRVVLLADTHLGFDQPIRPRVERRRRGPDFRANMLRVFEAAVDMRAHLVVHGGDLFFRARLPDALIDEVYGDLLRFAGHGIPLAIVPGNHERSRLPESLFLQHPGIHVFREPDTFTFELDGVSLALAGFPCVRQDIRTSIIDVLAVTGRERIEARVHLLCMHQTVDGATVGPGDFTFRGRHDVIRPADLPADLDAVLAGHIHRHQVLSSVRPDGSHLPVIYPGSVERTSFAEADETKGFVCVDIDVPTDGRRPVVRPRFVPLPARDMVVIPVPDSLRPDGVDGFLAGLAHELPADAIVRLRCGPDTAPSVRQQLTTRRLASSLPDTMNVDVREARS